MKVYVLMVLIGAIVASTQLPRRSPAKNTRTPEDQKLHTGEALMPEVSALHGFRRTG